MVINGISFLDFFVGNFRQKLAKTTGNNWQKLKPIEVVALDKKYKNDGNERLCHSQAVLFFILLCVSVTANSFSAS